MMMFDRFGEVGVNDIYKELYICIYRYRLEKKQIRYETMAKANNIAWIFQTIQNAKNLSQLSPIKTYALNVKRDIDKKYIIEEVNNVFENY